MRFANFGECFQEQSFSAGFIYCAVDGAGSAPACPEEVRTRSPSSSPEALRNLEAMCLVSPPNLLPGKNVVPKLHHDICFGFAQLQDVEGQRLIDKVQQGGWRMECIQSLFMTFSGLSKAKNPNMIQVFECNMDVIYVFFQCGPSSSVLT